MASGIWFAATAMFLFGASLLQAQGDVGYGPPPVPTREAPAIEIDNADHDWGRLMQGEKHRHAFIVTNSGTSDLRINNVKASCGCTTVDWPKVLEPGATGEIVLEIDTARLRSKRVKKYATISSNDPRTPQLKIYIQGELIQILDHEPKVLALSGLNGTVLESTTDADTRRAGYASHVTFATTRSLAFDYLRDTLGRRSDPDYVPLLRGLCHAVVDEADSVLIDQAGMPLVLAAPPASAFNGERNGQLGRGAHLEPFYVGVEGVV